MIIDLQEETGFTPRLIFERAREDDDGGALGKLSAQLDEAKIAHFIGTLEVLPEHASILVGLNHPQSAPIRDALHTILSSMALSTGASENAEGGFCLPTFMRHSLFGYLPIGGIPFSAKRRNSA